MSGFARRMLAEWRRLGWAVRGERVVVAVSGGADSTALLLALAELLKARRLGLEVTAAHLDHCLRGEQGAADSRGVEEQARAHGFDVVTGRADVGERAREDRDNLEQSARRARYEFLSEVARGCGASSVLVAHTLDDQAETILLRLLRGSGADGAGGMRPERLLEDGTPEEGSGIFLRRPLLNWARRADTEGYCRARGVEFRSDEMNEDERFARVRVRRRLVPLLETLNPRAARTLARAAELMREDSDALERLASELLEEADAKTQAGMNDVEKDEGAWPLRVEALASAHRALRRRALRQWLARGRGDLRRIEFAHVSAVEKLLEGTRGGRVAELPGGSSVERRRGLLIFHREDER
ncbi:MAG TPA: tRNA lysidine(34) synthetase TilS [Pyrinomonadaceae bacterium]|nr:tRNA lysidine(34) synthetase TilS [Pyrinomonadaceae bacterium]